MPKLPVVSSRQIINVLQKVGYRDAPARGKGSHRAFIRNDKGRTRLVIVPDRNEIPKGTLLSILEQAGMSKKEFITLLTGY
ncbi:YcfA-like protein [Candidatus Magnetobacterium bavaricum]|uniref:YcfA-like protein n=1 Tax=Candidatus Magnetobacterium bavaricum TaxID=29290 RepID=A0A0F3GKF9_9BACT|nr:YcfA-like protein [Candidatus Magnetobacterium bavaricum]